MVRYADLDLSTRAGAATLDRRIRTAAEAACGPTSDSDLHGKNQVHECRGRNIEEARAQARRAIALANRDGPAVLAGR